MMTRISTGTTVHSISITVLCEVRVGTGLRLCVEAAHHVDQQAEHEDRDQRDDDQQLVVKAVRCRSVTGVAGGCMPSCHGSRLGRPGGCRERDCRARPAPSRAMAPRRRLSAVRYRSRQPHHVPAAPLRRGRPLGEGHRPVRPPGEEPGAAVRRSLFRAGASGLRAARPKPRRRQSARRRRQPIRPNLHQSPPQATTRRNRRPNPLRQAAA